MSPRAYYTYVLKRPDGTPFYVGKGCGERYLRCGNNAHAQRVAKQIIDSGLTIGLSIIPASTEVEAFAEEVRLIALYGRIDIGTGSLCNLTDGGDGFSSEAAVAMHALRTPAQRSENARQGAKTLNALLTPEQRSENARQAGRKGGRKGGMKGGITRQALLTPEERRELSRKGATTLNALLTPEQRFANASRARAARRLSQDAFSLDNLPSPKRKIA